MAAVERPGLRLELHRRLHGLPALARNDPLLRNSLFLMLTIGGRSLLGFAYWVVAARMFPTSTIGLAAAFVSAYQLAAMIANPAIHSALTQELPAAGTEDEWSSLVNVGILLGATSAVIVGTVMGFLLPVVSSQFAPVTGGPFSFIGFVAGVLSAVVGIIVDFTFVAQRNSEVMFFRSMVFGLGKIPLLLLAVRLAGVHSSTGIWSTWILADVITVVVVVTVVLPLRQPGYRLTGRGASAKLQDLVRGLLGHHLTNLGGILPMYVLPVEVVTRVSSQANAYFYVTWMLCSLFFMISPSVEFALFTEGSYDPGAVWETARRSLKITGALLIVPVVGYALLGRFVLGIYGTAYARNGAALLLVLVVSAIPDAITNIYIAVLRVERRLVESSALNIGMALTALVSAWFLLPSMGIVGAGVAWLIAQVAGTVWTVLRVWRRREAAPVAI